VRDSGIGFNQEFNEQIFTIFQRLNDKKEFGGHGIGLALCRKIVGNHNGIIFSKGAENVGAELTMILPDGTEA
jgi:two-component system CheB/CheR fusion protein